MFIYVANNPVNNFDSSGHWIIKNAIKWAAENVIKPVVLKVKSITSKINYISTTGISFTGTPSFWDFNGQLGISVDTKENAALQGTFTGGLTGG